MVIILSEAQVQQLKRHSLNCYPEEACALLVGQGHNVEEVVLSRNIAEDPMRFFEIDPTARISVERKCRGTASRLMGVFHSHPDGKARPSKRDEAMVIEKHLTWLIASVDADHDFVLAAFQPNHNSGFEEVTLTLRSA